MKECNKCGYTLRDDQVFCNKCGTKWIDVEAIRKAEQEEREREEEKERKLEAVKKAKEEERDRKIAEEEAIKKAEHVEQKKIRREKEERKIAEREAKKKSAEENFKKAFASIKSLFTKGKGDIRRSLQSSFDNIKNDEVADSTKKVLKMLVIIFRWIVAVFFALFTVSQIFASGRIISGLCLAVVTYFACPLNIKVDRLFKIHPAAKLIIAIIFFFIAIFCSK